MTAQRSLDLLARREFGFRRRSYTGEVDYAVEVTIEAADDGTAQQIRDAMFDAVAEALRPWRAYHNEAPE